MGKNKKNPIKDTQQAAQEVTAPKRVRNLRALAFQSYVALAILVSIGLAILARMFPYFQIDLFVSQNFQSFNFPGLLPFMQFISFWGYNPQMPIIITVLVLFLFVLKFTWEAFAASFSIIGAGIITAVLKTLVGRGRPTSDLVNVVHNLHDNSFPSGHVLTYTAFFGFLFFLSFTLIKRSLLRRIMLLIFGALVVFVGPSRVYLGEHWPSDAFAAYLIGSIWLLISIHLYRKGRNKFFIKLPEVSN